MKPKIIAKSGTIGDYRVISGMAEQEKPEKYKAFRSERDGKFTDWFVGIMPNEGDFVYCREQGNFRSEGFGGRRMLFPLESGSVEVQGPWHTSPIGLFAATGYDCRDKHHTIGIYGLSHGSGLYNVHDVILLETKWHLGVFERVEQKAQELANKYQRIIHFWSYSVGGGFGHHKEPQ